VSSQIETPAARRRGNIFTTPPLDRTAWRTADPREEGLALRPDQHDRPPKPSSRGVRAALAPARPAQTIVNVRLSVVMVGLCRQRQELLARAGVVTDDAV
jgi:hypothetical protein